MDDWDPAFINLLAKSHQVIVFDNVGIGLTEGNTPQTIKEITSDAFQFTRSLGLDKFNILGWSMGGLVAQVFALSYPHYVNRIVLVATGPAGSAETVYPSEEFLERAKHDVNPPEDHQVLFFTKDQVGLTETMKSLNRMAQRQRPIIPPTQTKNWISQSLASRDFFSHPENFFLKLKDIIHPVLIGGAKQDIAFPMIDSYLLAREIPNSKLIIYSNSAHGFHHQYFDDFANEVNRFLQ
jgi:pimeloyl-ACP methyl ester carboxylesterase